MKIRHLALVPGLAMAFLAMLWVRHGSLGNAWRAISRSNPIIDCPKSVELGEQELGQLAVARFSVSNRGYADLVLDQIQLDCACSGLELERDGKFVPMDTVRLRPGERAALALRITARGVVGREMRNGVSFRTNDPNRPQASVEAIISKVTGGVTTFPRSVVFGRVAVGGQARETVEVHDFAATPRRIDQVVSTDPKRLDATLIPTGGSDKPAGGEASLIGKVEIGLITNEPGPVNSTVRIYLPDRDRLPDSISVTGQVVPIVAVDPPSLVLPRASKERPLYYGECVCRSSTGSHLTVEASSVPAGMIASVSDIDGDPSAQIVRIEWLASKEAAPKPATRVVHLKARTPDRESCIEIPVECTQGDRRERIPPK